MVKGTAKSKRSANGKRTASGNGTESDKDTADAKDTANSYVPPLVKALLTEKRKNKGSDLSSEVILSQRRARNCWDQKKKIRKVFNYTKQ